MSMPIHVRPAPKTRPASTVSPGIPQQRSTPTLRVVPRNDGFSKVGAVVCIVTFVVALIATLIVNIWLARGAYQLQTLQKEAAILAETEQIRSEQLNAVSTPSALCGAARSMGMQPAQSVRFIRLPDGKVLGKDPSVAAAASSAGVCSSAADTTATTTRSATTGE